MKLRRLVFPLLLVFVICGVAPVRFFSRDIGSRGGAVGCNSVWVAGFHPFAGISDRAGERSVAIVSGSRVSIRSTFPPTLSLTTAFEHLRIPMSTLPAP